MFASGAVKAITGQDHFGANAGSYNSKREAAELLRSLGHGTLTRAVTHFLGQPVHAAKARRGDVVIRGKAIGIVGASGFAWFVGEDRRRDTHGKVRVSHGLQSVPVLDCELAWRVG